jgi:DNA-binding phage protein
MQRDATPKRLRRRWRFRGICADAETLGVHRNSLYKVLSGERQSRSLMTRYRALKAIRPKATKDSRP